MNRHAHSVSLGILLALSALISACASPRPAEIGSMPVPWSHFGARPDPFWWSEKVQVGKLHSHAHKYGEGRTVALLDSGFLTRQADVSPSRIDQSGVESCTGRNNHDFDDINGHGTAMAVIALGDEKTDTPGGRATGGIATKAKLLPIKIVCGVSTADSVTRGVDVAIAAKVDVVLLALGGWPSDVDVNNKTVHDRLLDKVQAANISSPATLFVVASVWDNTTYTFPVWTTQGNVILVAAMMLDDALAEVFYSEKSGDIWAPGRNVETAFIDYGDPKYSGKYGEYLMQGTSAAAAIVAGCAAAVKLDTDKSAATLKARLVKNAAYTLPGNRPRLDCFRALAP